MAININVRIVFRQSRSQIVLRVALLAIFPLGPEFPVFLKHYLFPS